MGGVMLGVTSARTSRIVAGPKGRSEAGRHGGCRINGTQLLANLGYIKRKYWIVCGRSTAVVVSAEKVSLGNTQAQAR